MSALPTPSQENLYLIDHVRLLRRCLRERTGRDLLKGGPTDARAAEYIFRAPYVLLSHNADPDPILTYGNLKALDLFEISWEELTAMPSRLTAEAPSREERARLLAQVAERGFIDDYSGIRVSRAVLVLDLPVMIAAAVACLPVFFTGLRIARWEGILFLVYYSVYVGLLVLSATGYPGLAGFRVVHDRVGGRLFDIFQQVAAK